MTMPPVSPVPAAVPAPAASLRRSPFGTAPDGGTVECWTLDSGTGVRAEVLGYGATLRGLRVPDPAGHPDDIVLGLPSLADYTAEHPYLGAVVGRYANRIAYGRFTLDGGPAHRVPANDRGHALHGGPDGFHRRVWHAEPAPGNGPSAAALRLTLHSADGDMGFPGALDVEVVYRLTGAGTLSIDYHARTDRATHVNLTNHAYFNLAGAGRGDILGHTLLLDSAAYLPVTAEAVPLGPAVPTASGPFDFGRDRPIGERIGERIGDGPPGWPTRAAGGAWRCGPPSRASRCTPATRWTVRWRARTASRTNGTARSAWRPSTSRTHRTARNTRRPCCVRVRSTAAGPSSASPTWGRPRPRPRRPTALRSRRVPVDRPGTRRRPCSGGVPDRRGGRTAATG
jgi:galactose mutarotase-like enzyme